MSKEHRTANKDAANETVRIDLLKNFIEENLHIQCGPLILNAIRDGRLQINVVIGASEKSLDLFEIN